MDTNFYIDRMFGLPIVVPVNNGIVQEFNDHEYHGCLSQKTVGKHINDLREICKTSLYKTWLKNWEIGMVYDKTRYNYLEFTIQKLKSEIEMFGKTTISPPTKIDYYYNNNADERYNDSVQKLELNKKEAINLLVEFEEKFKDAKEKINFAKLQVFNKHQIQF